MKYMKTSDILEHTSRPVSNDVNSSKVNVYKQANK
jgi:hypothetical protein